MSRWENHSHRWKNVRKTMPLMAVSRTWQNLERCRKSGLCAKLGFVSFPAVFEAVWLSQCSKQAAMNQCSYRIYRISMSIDFLTFVLQDCKIFPCSDLDHVFLSLCETYWERSWVDRGQRLLLKPLRPIHRESETLRNVIMEIQGKKFFPPTEATSKSCELPASF